MEYTPLNYGNINISAGFNSPSSVKAFNNASFAFWQRSLFQRAQSVLDFEVPANWEGRYKDFFLYCLFRFGYVAVFKRDEYGFTFQPASLRGYDLYYQPTNALITNPSLSKSLDLEIGTECELLKLTPDYMGIWDIITYTAAKLSNMDNAIDMSIINNKFAFILGAKNKNAASALKKILDYVNKGEPAVIYDLKLANDHGSDDAPFQECKRDNLKNSYLTTDQLQDMQTIINNFDSEIGIPTAPYQKKERMITDEVDAKTYDAKARSLTWFKTLTSSIKDIKKLYPDINLSVKLHYDETEGTPADNDIKEVTT